MKSIDQKGSSCMHSQSQLCRALWSLYSTKCPSVYILMPLVTVVSARNKSILLTRHYTPLIQGILRLALLYEYFHIPEINET